MAALLVNLQHGMGECPLKTRSIFLLWMVLGGVVLYR